MSALKTFDWREKTYTVDPDELLDRVRRIAASGLPPEALNFKDCHVRVDDYRVSVKWLFHLITGANQSDFITTDARRYLGKIGIEVHRLAEGNEDASGAGIISSPVSALKTFDWRGQTYRVDPEELLERVRLIAASGLPPEALNFKDWHVQVDDYRVSVKWLFHLITGVDQGDFITTDARRYLGKIGIEVRRLAGDSEGMVGDSVSAPFPAKRAAPGNRKGGKKRMAAQGELETAHRQLDAWIDEMQRFLKGSLAQRPSDETLCNWVLFCYQFGLYAEGADLFQLVDAQPLDNPWFYNRTKRYASTCRLNARHKSKA